MVPDDDDVQNLLGEGHLRSSYYVAQENLQTIPTGINNFKMYSIVCDCDLTVHVMLLIHAVRRLHPGGIAQYV